jgi:cell division protein FtsI/penicillin-binding protein 2
MGYEINPGVTNSIAPGGEYNNLDTVDTVNYANLAAESAAEAARLVSTLGNYGSFYDTTTQVSTLSNQQVRINTLQSSRGLSLVDTGKIVISNVGTYKLTYSLQLVNYDNVAHYADIWLKFNGNNYPDSNTRFHIPARKSSSLYGYTVATVDFIGTSLNINDFVELYWMSDTNQVSLLSLAAFDGVPYTPSVIVNVSQV